MTIESLIELARKILDVLLVWGLFYLKILLTFYINFIQNFITFFIQVSYK